MRCLSALLLVLITVEASAQTAEPPYELDGGDRVRITLAHIGRQVDVPGPSYVGSVFRADVDSLSLSLNGAGSPVRTLAWSEVARVQRSGDNRTGEALGLLLGTVGGASVGCAVLSVLWEQDFACVGGVIWGGLGGMLAGGVIGANVGDGWRDVPSRAPGLVRLTIPIR